MAREVLDHGVVLPAEYSDNWYEDMTSNLQKLDEVIGSDGDKLSAADVATVAISGDYDDLTNKPSYGILRMTSETLTDSGSGAISNLNSDSKLAAGDYVIDAALKIFPITAVSAFSYTVGTSLFQITNASALAAVATSGSYDDLNNLPTYGITRFVNAAINDNSNVAFANISSVDKIKAGDFLLDNAGKMYLIASVDLVNETAAVTTPLTVLALDANVVHLSGNEDVNGIKNFKDIIPIDGDYIGNEASTNQRTNICLRSNRDTADKSGAYITRFRQNRAQGALQTRDLQMIGFDVLENEVRTNNVFSIQCTDWLNDVPQRVNFLSSAQSYSWGCSTNKSLFNDLNPGSLSLPDLSSGLDISGYITVPNTHNTYTPLVNGWISVVLRSTSGALAVFVYQGDLSSANYSVTSLPNETEPCVMVCLPVVANKAVSIDTKGSNAYVVSAKFYPCLGNV